MNLNAAGKLESTAAECDELIAIYFKCIETARKNRRDGGTGRNIYSDAKR